MKMFRNSCAVAAMACALGFSTLARAGLEVKVSDGIHNGAGNDSGTPGFAAFSGLIGNFMSSSPRASATRLSDRQPNRSST